MERNRVPSENFSEMRRLAEEHLKKGAQKMPEFFASPDEMQRLIHELAVHQIELEMQQEELLQSREELEEGLERLTELYDFAPLAYLALARDGTILQVNLTGTKLLGVERSRLVQDRFGRFIRTEDLADFTALLDRVFSSNAPVSCEVMLRNDETSPYSSLAEHAHLLHTAAVHNRIVRIDAVVSNDGQECRTIVLDISRQKQVEQENAELQATLAQVRKIAPVGRVAGGLAHDVNTMLQVMIGNLDVLIAAKGVEGNVREKLTDFRLFVLKSAQLPVLP